MQLLGGSEVSVPGRNGPAVARVHREPGAVRIDLPEVEVGAAAVGLAPVERRGLELDGAREQAAGGGAVCDVSGVLPVVTQRREGIALGRGTVLERRGPERGLAHRGEIQQGREICGDGPLPQRRQFDPQVVRVLAVVQRGALVRLARLQEQRVPLGADGPGIGARHGAQRDPPAGSTEGPLRREHAPVDHVELLVAPRAALVVVQRGDDAVDHQGPAAGGEMRGVHRRRVGEPGGAGAGARVGNVEGGLGHGHGVPCVLGGQAVGRTGGQYDDSCQPGPTRSGYRHTNSSS